MQERSPRISLFLPSLVSLALVQLLAHRICSEMFLWWLKGCPTEKDIVVLGILCCSWYNVEESQIVQLNAIHSAKKWALPRDDADLFHNRIRPLAVHKRTTRIIKEIGFAYYAACGAYH